MFDYFGKDEYQKQKKFQKLRDNILLPIVKFLTKLKIVPDIVTYFSMFLFWVAIFIIYEHPIIGGILGFLYCLLDGLDGPLARYQNNASKAGSLLDIANDQLGIIFIPVFAIYYFHTNAIFAYLFGFFYVMDVILIVVLNNLNIRTNFIIRVKYFYYFMFLISCLIKRDYIVYFHVIFSIFYMVHTVYLFWLLRRFYRG